MTFGNFVELVIGVFGLIEGTGALAGQNLTNLNRPFDRCPGKFIRVSLEQLVACPWLLYIPWWFKKQDSEIQCIGCKRECKSSLDFSVRDDNSVRFS